MTEPGGESIRPRPITIEQPEPHPLHLPPVLPSHAGKRYLVTGAARGLGKAVAALLTAQGASVWGVDILEAELALTAEELGLAGSGRIDVGDEQSIAAAIATARTGLGGFDGVVNIAGIVIHADPPGSLEAYWQEIGRAGRDGEPAEGITLYGPSDIAWTLKRLDGRPMAEEVKAVQELLGEHQDGVVARPVLRELGAKARLDGENGFTFGLLHGLETAAARQVEDRFPAAWRGLGKPKLR